MSLHLDLLRHGETESGQGFRGSLDDALSARGWVQMQNSVEAAGTCWDAVLSSPLQRCRAFAESLAWYRGIELHLEADLRELHFGDWEGRSAASLMETDSEALGCFWADPYAFTPPGGETLVDFEARVLAAQRRLCRRFVGRHLLLVSHGGVLRLLLARARRLPREQLLRVEVAHGALFGLYAGEGDDWHERLARR